MKSISFSAPMVRAILAGVKTQTRRIIKPQPEFLNRWSLAVDPSKLSARRVIKPQPESLNDGVWLLGPQNYRQLQTEDECWVKEPLKKNTWTQLIGDEELTWEEVAYQADGLRLRMAWRWKRDTLPSIFCPRDASRLTIRVTGVRCQQVQSISDEDIIAEGVDFMPHYDEGCLPREVFRAYWDSFHGKRVYSSPYGWQANPWVWAYDFEVVK